MSSPSGAGSGLTRRLQRFVVAPLAVLTLAVAGITAQGLWSNHGALQQALRDQADAQRAYALLLTQQVATQAMLLDASRVAEFSEQKLDAYDAHRALLDELAGRTADPLVRRELAELSRIDREVLGPLDMVVLEQLFVDESAARRLYLDAYLPTQAHYRERVRAIGAHTRAVAAAEGEATLRRDLGSLSLVVGAMLAGAAVVFAVVRFVGRRVESAQDELQSLMRGMDEGLFFFDATGRISAQRSQVLRELVPDADRCATLAELVTRHTSATAADVDDCLSLLWPPDDGFHSPFAATVTLLPARFTVTLPGGRRELRLRYRPGLGPDGRLERVYVSVVDVTQALEQERRALDTEERAERLCAAIADPEGFSSSRRECDRLFRQVAAALEAAPPELDEARRHLHTLKGATATAGFTTISRALHALEDHLGQGGAVAALHQRYLAEVDDTAARLGDHLGDGTVRIRRARLRAVRDALRAAHPEIARMLEGLERRPLSGLLGGHRRFVDALCERTGALAPAIVADPRSSEVTRAEHDGVDALLGHLVRNALDHGVEAPEERERAGKPRRATLLIACRRLPGGALLWSVTDDGRGIDGEALARRMVALGRWTAADAARATAAEKVELARLPELTSRDDVTETSGRGLGLHAVDVAVTSLGGHLALSTTPGVGTRVTLTLPTTPPSPDEPTAEAVPPTAPFEALC